MTNLMVIVGLVLSVSLYIVMTLEERKEVQ